ncbi:MAG: hypothetical protein QOG87_1315 [Actinomycetota bacterium]
MIFTSLGLLLVALGFLLAGIAKSSVALLMVSLFLTVGAGLVLVLVTAAAQRIVAAQQQQTAPTLVDLTAATPAAAPNGASAPVVGYDDMTAEQVVRLVRSGALSDEQLTMLVEYEERHQARKTVLDRAKAPARR